MEGKLINNKTRWYGHILRINNERIWKKVMNKKKSTQREDQDQDGNDRLGKMLHKRKEEHGKKLRMRSCGKTEIDGEAWLSNNPHK
jgi:hypothetical protein